jgi:hypothetical protein
MREEIKARLVLTYDADAADPLPLQIESILADVGRLADPDSTTGVELIRAEIDGDPLPEAEIYGNNGRRREARTRAGFDSFTVQRVREWTDAAGDSWVEPEPWDAPLERPQYAVTGGPAFWTVYARRDGEPSLAVSDCRSRAAALLMAEALADGRAVDCPDSMLPGFRVTWETVTDESAAEGDAAARGFADRHGGLFPLDSPRHRVPDAMPLREALDVLALEAEPWRNLEAVETDSSGPDAGARWISAIWRIDGPADGLPGGTDESPVRSVTLSIHFPETMTGASRARVCRAVRAAL